MIFSSYHLFQTWFYILVSDMRNFMICSIHEWSEMTNLLFQLEVKEERPYEPVKYEDTEDENEEEDNVLDDSEDYTEGSSDED